jgi:putative hydrolase of the HAD superfamily
MGWIQSRGDKNIMKTQKPIRGLFLDIGGVILTNGWDHVARQKAAKVFNLDYEELNERHHLTFDTYEEGKLSLADYLNRVIFFEERKFTFDEFRDFMFEQSQPFQNMIDLIKDLKQRYGLAIGAISNEGRELTVYRIKKYELKKFFDFFISSSFVHYRKPDEDMFRMALDVSQIPPDEAIYIEDRPMFVDVARTLGLHGIYHKSFESTRDELADYGLK